MTTQQQEREAWLIERRNYLGASESPVILGLSPYTTPYDVWREKQGLNETDTDSPILRFGRRVEQAVAEEYTDQTGRKLERYRKPQLHKQYPFLGCNPDRRVVGEKRLVQIKTSWKKFDGESPANAHCVVHDVDARVPEHMDIQVQHEMGITGAEVNDLAVATGFAGLCIYERPRDDTRINQIFTIDRAWWQKHMIRGIEPERTGRYLRELRGEDIMTSASELQLQAARRYSDIAAAIRRLEAQKDNLGEWLRRSMAGAKRLVDKPNGLSISWTPWTKEVEETDWEHLAESYRRAYVSLWSEVNSTNGHRPISATISDDLLNEAQRVMEDEAEGSLRKAVYTQLVTKSGEAWRVTWKDQPPAGEGESE